MRALLTAVLLVLAVACGKDQPDELQGFVVPGSIKREIVAEESSTTFEIEKKGGQRVVVRHAGPMPDMVKDSAEVKVVGRLDAKTKTFETLGYPKGFERLDP